MSDENSMLANIAGGASKLASIPGPAQAAILLMSMGEESAAQVLRQMGPKEVQSVGIAMAQLNNVSKEQVEAVMGRFIHELGGVTTLGMGSDEYIRNVLTGALGEDKANAVIDRILIGGNSRGLENLKWMDPKAIAEIIRLEHPQIIAIVLSYLESDTAAAVLSQLAERVRSDVLMRIASLEGIPPSALKELDDILEKQFSGSENVKSSNVGGVKTAANILNFMETAHEQSILDAVREIDGDLSQRIQDLMFVFDNLVDVDDRGMQTMLREISSDQLVLALKGADEAIKEKVFKNMSQRAAELLRDDLASKGPVKLSEVEGAQKEILAVAKRLSESGEIVISGKGGEEYV